MRWSVLLFLLLIPVVLAQDLDSLQLPPNLQKLVDAEEASALSLTMLIALFAGVLTFVSPCAFAILPVWLSLVLSEPREAGKRVAAFVVGMIVVYALLGLLAASVGTFFNAFKINMSRPAGLVLIIFACLLFVGKGFKGVHVRFVPKSVWGFVLLGAAFALGWSPCVGPVFGGIIVLASMSGKLLNGALLLVLYGVGVAIPMVLLASRASKLSWLDKLAKLEWKGKPVFNIIGALLLLWVGAIMALAKGTSPFETFFMKYDWTVQWLYDAQDWLMALPGVRSWFAVLLAIVILAMFVRYMYKSLR
ncbi:MAG: cytochrome c biogenesis CcdA family protein [Candidatus Woesearchaeota archaeon]|nr:cytochrome c biogenesis CcdA family protein [Candidatus Woesearchaeota archaeon]